MGLLVDAVKAGPRGFHKGPRCSTCMWLDSLDDETRAEAEMLLADQAWPHTELRRTFAPLGLVAASQSIGRHRQGDCARGLTR